MDQPLLLIVPLGVFLISMHGTRLLVTRLAERQILDHPNDRSSHTAPIPHGGGLALMVALLPAWAALGLVTGEPAAPLVLISGLAALLAAVSWTDDLRGLNPLIRIAAQAIAVAAALIIAPPPGPIFGGLLPPIADLVLAGILWVWFINLYNFMDGIDGLTGVQTITIGIGAFVIARKLAFGDTAMILSLTLAAAALGFIRFNWHPAKIFLGDVGSVPLGFLLGWLLLFLAAKGAWPAAILLPLYYLADATWTLVRRALSGKRIWQAHREHFYQRAVDSGLRHDQVVGIVGVANIFLIALSIVAARGLPVAAVLGGAAAVTLLLFLLAKGGPTD